MMDIGYGRIRDLGGLPDLLCEMAGQEGLKRVFDDQDISLSILKTPDALVPMRDLISLYSSAARITGKRSFGLVASSGLKAEEFGLAAQYAIQAPDLITALKRFQTALPYHESGSSLHLTADGNELRVGYYNNYQNMVGWRHAGDFTLCGLVTLISVYLGEGWQPLRIETCYAKGAWIQDHEDTFGAPVTFDADQIEVVLDREVVQHANGTDCIEPGKRLSMADVRCAGEEVPRNFPSMVVNVVARRLLEQHVDIEGAAAALGLGPRTVQRRLSGHGLNYRDLVLQCRMRLARELLVAPQAAIAQVALDVGYSLTPQFHRAFKEHVGVTPQGYRAWRLGGRCQLSER
jgi:AraC-like DNA-binding protein